MLNIRINKISTKKICFILLVSVFTFHFVSNLIFFKHSRFEFVGNSSGFFKKSLLLVEEDGSFVKLRFLKDIYASDVYPPVLTFVGGVAMSIFGVFKETVVMANMLYALILFLSLYGIARLYGGYKYAVFAVAIYSLYPVFFGYTRVFLTDLPMSAFVVLTIYLLMRITKGNYLYPVLAGLSLALAFLSRWLVPIYMFPVFAYLLLTKKISILQLMVTLTLAAFFSSLWYIPNMPVLLNYFKVQANIQSADFSVFKMNYLNYMYMEQLLMPFFVLSCISIIYALFSKKHIFLLLIVLWPFLFFSLFENRDSRYVLPVFPFIALLTVDFIASFKYRKIIAVIIGALALFQYILISYIPNDLNYLKKLNVINRDDQRGYYKIVDHGYWKTEEVLEELVARYNLKKSLLKVLIISPFQRVIYPLEVGALMKNADIEFYHPANQDQRQLPEIDFDPVIENSDYVIIKTGHQGIPWHQDYIRDMNISFEKYMDLFELIQEHILPDESILKLYRKKSIVR